ncbi:WAT1-related protein At5g40240-like isoform X2 [Durio zibethinus]|uniref:WAT1-related protein n=1 Tax=Durio zibethinus TaxID=66656 RepID=A0A6P6B942_DURZI|nr:WAT1-related protein At5g40240-like isoform X2 [Durio zibethinus]
MRQETCQLLPTKHDKRGFWRYKPVTDRRKDRQTGEEEEMATSYCYKDVLPFTAMVAVECTNVGLNILFKAATLKGMSYYIFITYSYAMGALLLLPLSFIFSRFLAQICAYKGIDYSSPTLASALGNLTPAFTFILAILYRLERVALRSLTSRAKIMGTVTSISGALLVVLYKGPKVFSSPPWTSSSVLLEWPLESSESNWVIGGMLLAVAYLLFSFWYIIQIQVLEMYPAELIVAFFYNLCAAIISAPVSFIAESDLSSWRLRPSIAVIAVLYSGVFSSFSSLVIIWTLHVKGPVYVAIFSPLSIAIAAFMSAIFLGDSLHIGSIIGAVIISMGFYAVIWGQAKEEESTEDDSGITSLGTSSNGKVPLLQSQEAEYM